MQEVHGACKAANDTAMTHKARDHFNHLYASSFATFRSLEAALVAPDAHSTVQPHDRDTFFKLRASAVATITRNAMQQQVRALRVLGSCSCTGLVDGYVWMRACSNPFYVVR